jgi:thermitase
MPLALSRHQAVASALVLGVCLLMLSGAAGRARADPPGNEFEPGQVVVELESAASLKKIEATYKTTRTERLDKTNVYLLHLQADSSVNGTLGEMKRDKRLQHAEPNFVIRPFEGEARHRAWGESDAEPSPQDDAASALNLSMAHSVSQGLGSTVAVLDTGVQLDHPALKANLEGVKGYDFVDNDYIPSDLPDGKDHDANGVADELVGHGTHVAGIVDRVAPAAKIMPVRVLDSDGYGNVFTIAQAVSFAKENGADVINLSLGTSSESKVLQKVIQDAIKKDRTKNGVLVAAAAGNMNTSQMYYPAAGNGGKASADGLVAVTSVNKYGQKSNFADYGSWVDIAAPGEGIRSAFPTSVYANWSGTSMATPFVSGEAALIHAVDGSLRPADLEVRIRCSARSLDETNPTFVGMLGAGHADVGASLAPGACDKTASRDTTITAAP